MVALPRPFGKALAGTAPRRYIPIRNLSMSLKEKANTVVANLSCRVSNVQHRSFPNKLLHVDAKFGEIIPGEYFVLDRIAETLQQCNCRAKLGVYWRLLESLPPITWSI
jgi:hypothetical protein